MAENGMRWNVELIELRLAFLRGMCRFSDGFVFLRRNMPQLLVKIKGAIAREWKRKGQNVDWELLERMEVHQKGVETAISHQFSSAGECLCY